MGSTVTTLSQSQIKSLLNAETQRLEQPIKNWQTQIQTDQAKISAWGKVGGAISSLSSAVNSISDPTSFNNRAATSSDKSVATASVQKGAPTGSYNLTNVTLAKSQSVYSQSYGSASASLGSSSGSLVIKSGSGSTETVSVKSANMTLNGVAQAINNVSGGQVKASVVGGSGGDRLVITGDKTGSSASFSVTGKGGLSGFQYAASGSSNTFTQARAATNATLNVNGVPVSSATNTLSSAIPSGTLTLSGSGSAKISVNEDTSKLSSAVSSVVSKLNGAVQTIQKETKFSKGGSNSKAKTGPLLGNYSAADLANQLDSAVSGLSTSQLAARNIGITVNKDGSVSFDSSKFASAYKSNPSGVNGLVKQLYTKVNSITQMASNATSTGIVGEQKSSLNSTIKNLNHQISQQKQFVNEQMNAYSKQYSNLLGVQSKYANWSGFLNMFNSTGSSSSGGSSNGG